MAGGRGIKPLTATLRGFPHTNLKQYHILEFHFKSYQENETQEKM
jgi:hypothetical protein